MLFNSYAFILVFLPATVAGYLLLAGRWPWATVYWLVGASLVFYAGWDPRYLPLLVGSATLTISFELTPRFVPSNVRFALEVMADPLVA